MNRLFGKICLYGLVFISSMVIAAEGPPLKIATDNFSPPFTMRGANEQMFGFDVTMMQNLCQLMNRTCTFIPMPFSDVLKQVESSEVDLGIGSITITLERAQKVTFSIPYLLSYAQYIALKKNHPNPKFSVNELHKQRIGVEFGGIFRKAIDQLNFSDVTLITYQHPNDLLDALTKNEIQFALVDASAAFYWQNQTNQQIIRLGKPFLFGYGFGIAVNPNDSALLQNINTAILEYQNNGQFQKAYNEYIAEF